MIEMNKEEFFDIEELEEIERKARHCRRINTKKISDEEYKKMFLKGD